MENNNVDLMKYFIDMQGEVNSFLIKMIKKNNAAISKTKLTYGLVMAALGYSVYVQAIKIDKLSKKIEELESQKGE